MFESIYYELVAAHVVGFTGWIGMLAAALHILRTHAGASAEAAAPFVGLEKRVGIAMDASAMLTIVAGIALLVGTDMGSLHLQHGYMHAKLTGVAAVLGIHVFTRVRIKQMRSSQRAAPPIALVVALYVLVVAIVSLITVGPAAAM